MTIGGIGLTGTIVDITFKLKDIKNTNFITKKNRVSSLEECIQILKTKAETIIRLFIHGTWLQVYQISKMV